MSNSSIDDIIGKIASDYTDRLARGEDPDVETYVGRAPKHAIVIRRLLESLRTFHPAQGGQPGSLENRWSPLSKQQLGDFLIQREIGRGGMGIVYEAVQMSLGRRVALKVLPFAAMLDERQLQRFRTEARAAAGLHHPNIVPVHFVGEDRGVHYYAMQYVEGQSLAALIQQERRAKELEEFQDRPTQAYSGSRLSGTAAATEPIHQAINLVPVMPDRTAQVAGGGPSSRTDDTLSLKQSPTSHGKSADRYRTIAQWGAQIADALEYAHGAGIIHRDIKPSNILLDSSGKVWVTDFGLARVVDSPDVTMTGDLIGTLRYMSPEQAAGRRALIDERSDVYSLGVTLYELLTLRPMIQGEDRQQLLKSVQETEATPLRRFDRNIPNDLEMIVLKAVAKERELRYATPKEIAEDLRRFLEHVPVRASRPTLAYRASKWFRRHQEIVWTAMGVLSLLLVVSCIWLFLYRDLNEKLGKALQLAQQERKLLEKERRRAEQAFLQDRQTRYLQDVERAGEFWRQGDLQHVAQLLTASIPGPGERDLRGFEWHFLWSLSQPAFAGVPVAEKDLYCVTYSPDGKYIATAGQEPTVCIFDAESLTKIVEFPTGQIEVNSVSFSPNGDELASAGDDGTVIIWNWRERSKRLTIAAHTHVVFSAIYAKDGSVLASGGNDGFVHLWNPADGKPLHTFSTNADRVDSITISDDSQFLAAASVPADVYVWNLKTRELAGRLTGHTSRPLTVRFSADVKHLISAGRDMDARIWELRTMEGVQSVAHSHWVQALDLQPSTSSFTSGTHGGAIWNRSLSDAQPLTHSKSIPWRAHLGGVTSLCYHPDGNSLASVGADGRLRIWPHARAPQVVEIQQSVHDFTFIPGSDDVILCGPSDLEVWSLKTGNRKRTIDRRDGWQRVHNVEVSADASTMVVIANQEDRQRLEIWDLMRLQLRAHLPWSSGHRLLGVSPDGSKIVVGTPGDVIQVINADTGQISYSKSLEATYRAAMSVNGRYLAISQRAAIVVIDLEAKTERMLTAQAPPITELNFTPGAQMIVGHYEDQTLRFWDRASGNLLGTAAGLLDSARKPQFSPDGATMAVGGKTSGSSDSIDRSLQLWNVARRTPMLVLDVSREGYEQIRYSLDGRYIGCYTAAGRLTIYDCGHAKPLAFPVRAPSTGL